MKSPSHSSGSVMQQDIALALGISQVAVSLALRNSPRISEKLRKQVQATAAKMGYHPNPLATAFVRSKKNSRNHPVQAALAWLNCWPDPKQLRSYPAFQYYWKGAMAAAEKLGYRLEEFRCDARMTPGRLEDVLVARGIQGVLIPPQPIQPDWGRFDWSRFSVVRLGRSPTVPAAHVVTTDQVHNTLTAFEAMSVRGYQRIGFVGIDAPSDYRWLFDAGFLRAQMTMAPKARLPIIGLDPLNPHASQRELMCWLKKEKPDAVLTPISVELPDILAKCGCRVPEDIGLATVGDLNGKIDAGIFQNPQEIGRVAMLMLASLITDNDRGVPTILREVLIRGQWTDGTTLPRRNGLQKSGP